MTVVDIFSGLRIPSSAAEWKTRGTFGSGEKDEHNSLMLHIDNAVAVRETGDTRLHSPVELAVALELATHVPFSLIKQNEAVRLYRLFTCLAVHLPDNAHTRRNG